MTRLNGMDDEDMFFTVAVSDGQLILSVPIEALEEYDPIEFHAWVSNNAATLGEMCRVAIMSDRIEQSPKVQASTKQVKN